MELSEHAPDTQTDLQLQNSLEKNARRKPTAQMCEAWLSWMSSMTPLWNRKTASCSREMYLLQQKYLLFHVCAIPLRKYLFQRMGKTVLQKGYLLQREVFLTAALRIPLPGRSSYLRKRSDHFFRRIPHVVKPWVVRWMTPVDDLVTVPLNVATSHVTWSNSRGRLWRTVRSSRS